MMKTGGIADLQLLSSVQQQEVMLNLRQADPLIPDISSLPVNPFQEDEGQGYDSHRSGQRILSASKRRDDGEEASRDVVAETFAVRSKLHVPAPECDPLPVVRNIPTSWRTCSPRGIAQPVAPPPVESWCAPQFLEFVERVKQQERELGVACDDVSPEEQVDIDMGDKWASQAANMGMSVADAEAAASLVTLGGGSKSGMHSFM